MKIFLDTAEIDEIRTAARWGVLDGVNGADQRDAGWKVSLPAFAKAAETPNARALPRRHIPAGSRPPRLACTAPASRRTPLPADAWGRSPLAGCPTAAYRDELA
jgi:hypothetical protein